MHTTSLKTSSLRALALLAVAVLGSACATTRQSSTRDPRDPWEGWNRSVYKFNTSIDDAVAQPVAKAYAAVTPKPVRSGVANFLGNIAYPGVVVQDLLQAKPKQFAHDTGRLLVNSTVGIGGLFDPATGWGLQANNEDFGQTFGRWGIPPGPYLMLPVLGPSTLRDTVGMVGDHYVQPETYLKSRTVGWGLSGLRLVERRAQLLGTEAALERYLDPYAFVRNSYLQRRIFLIYDGNPPDQDIEYGDGHDEP
jgi:phospholipid-binding lipoprotein MlaA